MEAILSKMSQNGTTLYDDTSYRLKERPSSQPASQSQPSKFGHLALAPGQGQGFADIGSSFGAKKTSDKLKRVVARRKVESDSEDEMNMLPSTRHADGGKRVHKAKSTSQSKGKNKATTDESDGVVIGGKRLPFHEDYKPKPKLPKINKVKSTISAEDGPSPPKAMSASRPKPKAAYLGSSSNPIPVAVERESKSKPSSPPSSCTSPLHDRSPNQPSHARARRPMPQAAFRSAKKPTSDTSAGSSSHATDLDSPPKGKGKAKLRQFPMEGISPVADRRVQQSSSFPHISPLASPTAGYKRQPFPAVPPLSSAAKTVNSDDDHNDSDDELGLDPDDDILTRGGPRPFPMSTQTLQSIQQAGKRLSASIGENETRESKKRKDEDAVDDEYVLFTLPDEY
jgi:hypothetical protein